MQQQQSTPHPQEFAEEFTGFEGLSEQERNELMEEQRRIMKEIEKNKAGNAASALAARAEAFDQRSNTAVARVAGGEPSFLSRPWSRPTTQSEPKRKIENDIVAATSKEEADQMEADRRLAEQLQKEEYSIADREERRAQRAQRSPPTRAAATSTKDQSWMEWLGLSSATPATPSRTSTPAPAPAPPAFASPGLSSVTTGEETINFYGNERERLVNRSGGGARIAQQKPLFSCVADSISTAASSITGMTLSEDQEGNVNGVDSSSLLAVSNVSRNTDYQQFRH